MSAGSTHAPSSALTHAVRRDLRTLATFIDTYCRNRHTEDRRPPVRLRMLNVETVCRRPLRLCPACGKLLAHAFVKRLQCPLDPKPACKRCPSHCYAPLYRAQIRDVMKSSGRYLLLRGRLHYLFRLLF